MHFFFIHSLYCSPPDPEGIAEYKKLDKEYPKTIFDQDFDAFMKKIAYSIVYVNTIEELQRNIYK